MTALSPQAIFLEHERWLRTVVRSRLQETDAVEDVMQNIALAIVRQRDALQNVTRIGSWLYQIALRQVLMHRRTSGRRRKMLDRVTAMMSPEAAGSYSGTPVDHVMAAENQESVRRALASLSDVDRQILLLKYTEEWSYRQLADHLGVREDTVEYRLLKARKNLRKQLAAFAEDHA